MKRWSTSLVGRAMEIKTRMSYHFIPTQLAIKKKKKVTGIGKDMERLKIIHQWWVCKQQSLCKSLAGPQKIKHRILM